MISSRISPLDGETSGPSGPSPIPNAALQTAAIIASRKPSAPLPSAPSLRKISKELSTFSGNGPLGPAAHNQITSNLEQQKQSHEPPSLLKGPRSFRPSAPKTVVSHTPSTPKQNPTLATPRMKQKDTLENIDNKEMILRSGKWTPEEELYANILIELFEEGSVDEYEYDNDSGNNNSGHSREGKEPPPKFKITNGMTLRAYLSRKLFCSPMRISKKFAGKGIGKLVYMSQNPSTYLQHWQRCSSSCMPIFNNTAHFQKMNRLKQAESNFLRIAFPNGDPKNMCNKNDATPSPIKQSSSSAVNGISSNTSKASQTHSSSCVPLQIQAPLPPNVKTSPSQKLHLDDTIRPTPPVSTTEAPLTCPSLKRNARPDNILYPPLVALPSRSLQFLKDQPSNLNIQLVDCQNRPNIIKIGRETNLGPSPICSPKSLKNPQPSPMMAAPKLLSPNSNHPQLMKLLKSTVKANNSRRTELGATLPLLQMETSSGRQLLQQQNRSKIQDLKDAYITSVSPNQQSILTNAKTSNTRVTASQNMPSQILQNAGTIHDSGALISLSDMMHKFPNNQSGKEPESSRVVAFQQSNDDAASQPAFVESNPLDAQPSIKAESVSTFDWKQIGGESTKAEVDLPNFLSGFDKVSKNRPSGPFEPTSGNNAAVYSEQCAEYSPAYYTSKSFDDFHRYLGKGLSPKLPPPPKFPNLQNTTAGPVIPSIESSNEASISNLQMRPRNQHSISPDLINGNAIIPKFCVSIPEKSGESLLSEAYEEAVKNANRPHAPEYSDTHKINDYSSTNQDDAFGEQPKMMFKQNATYALRNNVQNTNQTELRRSDSASEFPLEGMKFEDFDTLAAYPITSTSSCSSFSSMCATVTDPLQASKDPRALSEGGLISDDSESTLVDQCLQGKKRKSRPTLEQSIRARGRISFDP